MLCTSLTSIDDFLAGFVTDRDGNEIRNWFSRMNARSNTCRIHQKSDSARIDMENEDQSIFLFITGLLKHATLIIFVFKFSGSDI